MNNVDKYEVKYNHATLILFCNLVDGNSMGKLFVKNIIIRDSMNIMLKSQELPYLYKSAFLRLYYQLFLNKKNLEAEEFMFILKECIIPDFDHRTVTK
jgi:hypothetical protein